MTIKTEFLDVPKNLPAFLAGVHLVPCKIIGARRETDLTGYQEVIVDFVLTASRGYHKKGNKEARPIYHLCPRDVIKKNNDGRTVMQEFDWADYIPAMRNPDKQRS